MYSESGQRYIVRPTSRELASHASNSNLESIEKFYGAGTRLYFVFLIYSIIINIFFGILCIFPWIIHVDKYVLSFEFDDLFVSNYSPEILIIWKPTMFIFFIFWIISAFPYMIWEHFRFYKLSNTNEIPKTKSADYIWGIMFSGAYLIVVWGILTGLVYAQKYVSEHYEDFIILGIASVSLAMSIPPAIFFVISCYVWDTLSLYITMIEENRTWFKFKISRCLKLIIFKVATATFLYSISAKLLPSNTCLIPNSGVSLTVVLLIDSLLVSTFLKTIIPFLMPRILARCGRVVHQKPEFDIAEHLLQIIYKQYIVFIGSLVFPFIGFINALCLLLQYQIDKIQLYRICEDPQYVNERYGIFTMVFIIITAVLAFFTFPNGAFWLLFIPKMLPSGYTNCTFFQSY